MPTPLGHALGGVIAGWAVRGRCCSPESLKRIDRLDRLDRYDWLWLAGLGMFADIDLLFGTHGTCTHSIGAAAIVAICVAAIGAMIPSLRPWRLVMITALTAGIAYGSHVLLDWLATDTSPPIGILALWP